MRLKNGPAISAYLTAIFLRLFVGFKMVESLDIPKVSSPEVYSTHFGHIGSISGSKKANFGPILRHLATKPLNESVKFFKHGLILCL